jgi:hypothetical protein
LTIAERNSLIYQERVRLDEWGSQCEELLIAVADAAFAEGASRQRQADLKKFLMICGWYEGGTASQVEDEVRAQLVDSAPPAESTVAAEGGEDA